MNLVLLALPAGGQFGAVLLELGQFLFERFQPPLGRIVTFSGQRLALDLQLNDPPVERLDFFRFRFHFHADS